LRAELNVVDILGWKGEVEQFFEEAFGEISTLVDCQPDKQKREKDFDYHTY